MLDHLKKKDRVHVFNKLARKWRFMNKFELNNGAG